MVDLKHKPEDCGRGKHTGEDTAEACDDLVDLLVRSIHCHGVFVVKFCVLIASQLYILCFRVKLSVDSAVQLRHLQRNHHILSVIILQIGQRKKCTADQNKREDPGKSHLIIQSVYDLS